MPPYAYSQSPGVETANIEKTLSENLLSTTPSSPSVDSPPPIGSNPVENKPEMANDTAVADVSANQTDLSRIVIPPNDPCLPGLYTDWQELSQEETKGNSKRFHSVRIVITRSDFRLTLEGIRRDGRVEDVYNTSVGLGDYRTPTPEGRFFINHIYCYPDVLYFDPSSTRVQGLYNGFFAPVLACDSRGRCARYRDLGIHGYYKENVGRRVSHTQTYGAISAGCVRLPDPCKFKSELIRVVGIGPAKQNDRGTYHWLKRPVELIITDYEARPEEDPTLTAMFQQSLDQVQGGLRDLLSIFGN